MRSIRGDFLYHIHYSVRHILIMLLSGLLFSKKFHSRPIGYMYTRHYLVHYREQPIRYSIIKKIPIRSLWLSEIQLPKIVIKMDYLMRMRSSMVRVLMKKIAIKMDIVIRSRYRVLGIHCPKSCHHDKKFLIQLPKV